MKKLVVIILLSVSVLYADIFVVNSISETISRINIEEGTVDNSYFSTGSMPNKIAFWQEQICLVNSGDNNIALIDIETGQTEQEIFIEDSSNPYDLIVVGDFAYVTGALTNKLYKIDLQNATLFDEVEVGANPMGVIEFGNKLYVANSNYTNNYQDCSVSVIDKDTFEVEATIAVSANPKYFAEYDGMLHVSCAGNWYDIEGKINVINPQTNEVVETLDIGGVTSNFAFFLDDIFLGDELGNGIYRYNPNDYSVINGGENPLLPGAQLVSADETNFYSLGGSWDQNFVLKVYNSEFSMTADYEVGMSCTDIKIYQAPNNNENDVLSFNHQLNNFPNPFNPTTTISFAVEKSSNVQIDILNVKGQRVKRIADDSFSVGNHQVRWNGTDDNEQPTASGIYFYRLIVDNKIVSMKKCVLIK